MSATQSERHLVVLGAGPGGYPAAFLAAHHGLKVTMIDERSTPGGVCLHVGCIPSKALLHVAKVINESHEAENWGIQFSKPKIDLDKLRGWKDKIVKRLTTGLGAMAKQHKVRFVQGRGKFIDSRTIQVGDEKISFDHCLIATGSRPAMPKLFDIGSDAVMDSTGALELKDIPKTLLVVGGGYIGLEMGSVYAALGSKTTVVEMAGSLLPGADKDLSDILSKQIKGRFEDILIDTRVTEMKAVKGGVEVKLLGLDLKDPIRKFDKVLISVGRAPNSWDLGLENTKVKVNDRGFIVIDGQRQTGEPGIYAIGDVAGEPGLAHKATHEGRVAVEAMLGEPAKWDPACIPAVVFTDPEVAWVGLTENDALNRHIPHKVSRFPWAASGRAIALDRPEGLTKLVLEPNTGRILGAGIVGVGAGDLIAEMALAIEMGTTAQDLALTIHPHPTTSETFMEAAELFLGHSAHFIAKR